MPLECVLMLAPAILELSAANVMRETKNFRFDVISEISCSVLPVPDDDSWIVCEVCRAPSIRLPGRKTVFKRVSRGAGKPCIVHNKAMKIGVMRIGKRLCGKRAW